MADILRNAVKVELDKVTKAGCPEFYKMIQTPDGYRRAEDMVINFAIKNQLSIGAAIGQLENEMQ